MRVKVFCRSGSGVHPSVPGYLRSVVIVPGYLKSMMPNPQIIERAIYKFSRDILMAMVT